MRMRTTPEMVSVFFEKMFRIAFIFVVLNFQKYEYCRIIIGVQFNKYSFVSQEKSVYMIQVDKFLFTAHNEQFKRKHPIHF